MKAEHRKELQTNSLADMLGRTVRNVRGGAGLSWFKLAIFAVVALGLLFWYIRSKNVARQDAEAWAMLQHNDSTALQTLASESPNTRQGQAARAMLATENVWFIMRSLGGDRLRFEGAEVVKSLEVMKFHFEKLADECKENTALVAECKYNVAICTEVMAAYADKTDDRWLTEAKKLFKELAEGECKSTAHGVLAKKRLDQYEDSVQYAAISSFYRDLQARTKFDRSLK